MSKQIEALKLALEALEYWHVRDEFSTQTSKAITAIREALAEQPAQQQEPVAWATQMGEYAHIHWGAKRPEYPMVYEFPLYTSPPASKPWVGLTDEEVDECYYWKGRQWTTDELVRHVEAKLREKNNG